MKNLKQQKHDPGLTIVCTNCGKGFVYSECDQALLDIIIRECTCQFCGISYKPLDAHLRHTATGKTEFFSFLSFGMLGESTTRFNYKLKVGEVKEIKFAVIGIPDDAKVIRMYQTRRLNDGEEAITGTRAAGKFAFPSMVQQKMSLGEEMHSRVTVVGVPWQPPIATANQEEATISVELSWLSAKNAEVYGSLFSALKAFYRGSYTEAIISANASVERALYRVCDSALKDGFGLNKRREFLESQCTYSGQLNFLCKIICKWKLSGSVPDELIGQLNRMRSLRNQAAHRGEFDKAIAEDEIYKLICVAIFGTHLFQAMSTVLVGEPTGQKSPVATSFFIQSRDN